MEAPLEQLHDILPGPDIGIFNNPTTVLMGVAATIFSGFIIYRIYRSIPHIISFHRAKRHLRTIYKTQNENFVPFINLLLKKVASRYWHREQFAGLHTKEWLYFLDAYSKCQFAQYADKWEMWSYSGIALADDEKKAIYRECKKWLRTTSSRRPL